MALVMLNLNVSIPGCLAELPEAIISWPALSF